jgi:uncharacterized protein YecE (DUF72 family)
LSTQIRLGTSSFTADGWSGHVYPKGIKSADYLNYCSHTVEVDSRFYRCPTMEATNKWALQTPPGFIFSLKIPCTITHEKVLVDCDKEFEEFVGTAHVLGEKLLRPEPASIKVMNPLRATRLTQTNLKFYQLGLSGATGSSGGGTTS